jgi:hypothetical protein
MMGTCKPRRPGVGGERFFTHTLKPGNVSKLPLRMKSSLTTSAKPVGVGAAHRRPMRRGVCSTRRTLTLATVEGSLARSPVCAHLPLMAMRTQVSLETPSFFATSCRKNRIISLKAFFQIGCINPHRYAFAASQAMLEQSLGSFFLTLRAISIFLATDRNS